MEGIKLTQNQVRDLIASRIDAIDIIMGMGGVIKDKVKTYSAVCIEVNGIEYEKDDGKLLCYAKVYDYKGEDVWEGKVESQITTPIQLWLEDNGLSKNSEFKIGEEVLTEFHEIFGGTVYSLNSGIDIFGFKSIKDLGKGEKVLIIGDGIDNYR